MKKLYVAGLILAFSLSMVACNTAATENENDETITASETLATEEPEVLAPIVDEEINQDLLPIADDFFNLMASDSNAAYASTHDLFKTYTSEEEFNTFIGQFSILSQYDSYEFSESSMLGEEAILSGLLVSEAEGTFELNLIFDETEDGNWLVSGLDILFLY